MYAVVAVVSYLFAGRNFLIWPALIIGALTFFGAKALGKSDGTRAGLLCFFFGISFLVVGGVVSYFFVISDIYVDNFTDVPARLELNGHPWLNVDAQKTERSTLRRGTYEIAVFNSQTGKEIDRRTVEVDSGFPHIYNVGGGMSYILGTAEYGAGTQSESKNIEDVWFEARVQYVFESPPDSISVDSKSPYGSRTYLVRNGPTGKTFSPPAPAPAATDPAGSGVSK